MNTTSDLPEIWARVPDCWNGDKDLCYCHTHEINPTDDESYYGKVLARLQSYRWISLALIQRCYAFMNFHFSCQFALFLEEGIDDSTADCLLTRLEYMARRNPTDERFRRHLASCVAELREAFTEYELLCVTEPKEESTWLFPLVQIGLQFHSAAIKLERIMIREFPEFEGPYWFEGELWVWEAYYR